MLKLRMKKDKKKLFLFKKFFKTGWNNWLLGDIAIIKMSYISASATKQN